MKLEILTLLAALLTLPLNAEIKDGNKKSLLNDDPDVVYLEQTLKKPINLQVIREAPVFSDKNGAQRLGTLKSDQTVRLEAITEKVYRVRGQGTHDGISGWVAPWAFSSSDPDFVANLKALYERQIQIQSLIAAKAIAVGMTLEEVQLSLGKPSKTTVRQTATGQSGRWEFIEFEDVKNYTTEVNPITGVTFRRLVSVTRVEKSKTAAEFENDIVTAIEASEDHQGGTTKIIIPPLVFRW